MIALAAATLVVCAPGFPGSSAEARPAMEALARSLTSAGHLAPGSLSAVYEETEAGGLRRLAKEDAALLLAPLPFFLDHERELRLVARLSAVPRGGEALERWTLVVGKDHPASLEGYTVQSTAGYSKRFVRAAAPGLPAQLEIQASGAVLSALRRAADGEKVAVLLDGAQAAALGKLPFASSLAAIGKSPPMPVAVVATVGKRMDPSRWKALEPAFRRLAEDPAAREDPRRPESFAGAIRAKAFQLGREKDGGVRLRLAESAVAIGQLCEENAPAAALCDYWLAAALGLQARERSATAKDGLPRMTDLLRRAARADPAIDRGGPHRLLATVLLRAPGWPLGPGG